MKVDIEVCDPAMPRWWNALAGFALRVRHRHAQRTLRRQQPHLPDDQVALLALRNIGDDVAELLTTRPARAPRRGR